MWCNLFFIFYFLFSKKIVCVGGGLAPTLLSTVPLCRHFEIENKRHYLHHIQLVPSVSHNKRGRSPGVNSSSITCCWICNSGRSKLLYPFLFLVVFVEKSPQLLQFPWSQSACDGNNSVMADVHEGGDEGRTITFDKKSVNQYLFCIF